MTGLLFTSIALAAIVAVMPVMTMMVVVMPVANCNDDLSTCGRC